MKESTRTFIGGVLAGILLSGVIGAAFYFGQTPLRDELESRIRMIAPQQASCIIDRLRSDYSERKLESIKDSRDPRLGLKLLEDLNLYMAECSAQKN